MKHVLEKESGRYYKWKVSDIKKGEGMRRGEQGGLDSYSLNGTASSTMYSFAWVLNFVPRKSCELLWC